MQKVDPKQPLKRSKEKADRFWSIICWIFIVVLGGGLVLAAIPWIWLAQKYHSYQLWAEGTLKSLEQNIHTVLLGVIAGLLFVILLVLIMILLVLTRISENDEEDEED